ncbi:hypothetical protein CEXT_428231 [Caerostris extrusa]|uniref:Dehydrogenase/reductase SDR family member 11 n=1 Tax=Caerostris extrusa TaxID=172846 RepID=A0AAV4Q1W0_CAEEX|nr:hypothetical protein CEXT_428231 [Caerostris extrusa]
MAKWLRPPSIIESLPFKDSEEMERWNGRVALVTGAVDKIRAIAEEDEVKAAPGKLVAIKCDLTKESEILSLFDEIRRTFGRLDVCINNAGLGFDMPLLTATTSGMRNILDVNVLALCICTQQAVKLMQEKGVDDGQIIHISSVGGHFMPTIGLMGAHFYCSTKFMVRALTEGLRKELKALNSHIRIASLSPGLVDTEFFNNYFKEDPSVISSGLFGNIKALETKDMADSVIHILKAPPHVEIHDIIVRPYDL